jgi:hypothetical protein
VKDGPGADPFAVRCGGRIVTAFGRLRSRFYSVQHFFLFNLSIVKHKHTIVQGTMDTTSTPNSGVERESIALRRVDLVLRHTRHVCSSVAVIARSAHDL